MLVRGYKSLNQQLFVYVRFLIKIHQHTQHNLQKYFSVSTISGRNFRWIPQKMASDPVRTLM